MIRARAGTSDGEARADRRPHAVQHRFAGPVLDAEELVELVDFGADLFAWRQRHQHELAMLRCVENPAEVVVADGQSFDVLYEAFMALPPCCCWNL